MTKSRMALLFVVASAPGAALAQGDSGDQAVAAQQTMIREIVAQRCPMEASADAIIVCGRRPGIERYRLPVPAARDDGVGAQAGGEQLAAMDAGNDRCSAVGRDQQCNGGLNVIAIAFTMVRGIVQALANRD